MSYDKIDWCLKQNKGIKLVEPNNKISENYLNESAEDYEMIEKSNEKWKAVTAYYSCYNSLCAILTKIGIKSEIHDCSIALMSLIGFEDKNINFLNELKRERIDIQYYLKHPSLKIEKSDVSEFNNKCREVLLDLNDNKINDIRKKIKEIINKNKVA